VHASNRPPAIDCDIKSNHMWRHTNWILWFACN